MNFLLAIFSAFIVSLVSLIGIFSLLLSETALSNILLLLLGFGAGGLIGGAFLHILPEAVGESEEFLTPFIYAISGFALFFLLEKFFYWRHCHNEKCDIHIFTYLNLIGDGFHNFIDGLVIGTSFLTDIRLGVITTLAIVMHEIPQELGDFGVLVYGGFGKFKALFWNFISAAVSIIGAIIGYFFASRVAGFEDVLLSVAGGGFIYIASCDLIPELHKQPDKKKSMLSIIFFLLGIFVMLLLKLLWH